MIKLLTQNRFLIPIGLFLLNFIVKFIYIDYGDIAGDEPFTLFYAQVGMDQFGEMLERENNPPLFFMLTHFWIKFFGIEATSVRMLPLIFSALTAPFIYLIGKRFFNLKTGLVAALLFTFSSHSIYYAHETRVYSLFGLLTTTSMFGFLSMMKNQKSKGSFWLFIISNALLIYSHFFGFFVFAVQVISLLLIPQFRKRWKKVSFGFLIVLALYLPYLPTFISRFLASKGGTWVAEPTIKSLYYVLKDFSNVPITTVFYVLIIAFGVIYTIYKKSDKISPYAKSVFIWFLFPYLSMFLVSFKLPMFIERYLTHVSIGYFLLIAVAIYQLKSIKWANLTLPIVTVILIISTTNLKSGHLPNRKSLVKEVLTQKDDQTAVIICPPWLDLEIIYHYNLSYFKDFDNSRTLFKNDNFFAIHNSNNLPSDEEMKKFKKIIFLDSWAHLTDPNKTIMKWIDSKYKFTHSNDNFKGYQIYYYQK